MRDTDALTNFLDDHVSGLPDVLYKVERDTHLYQLQSHMLSGKTQAAFLRFMVALIKPSHVLEIGTYTGYATIAMADVLPTNSKITTIEVNEEMAEKAKENFKLIATPIHVICGNAKHVLIDLLKVEVFDFVYVDADKIGNDVYYELLLPHMPSDGVICVDNVLWKGKVWEDGFQDKKTNAIRSFLSKVVKDERVEAQIMPLRDGLLLIRKK